MHINGPVNSADLASRNPGARMVRAIRAALRSFSPLQEDLALIAYCINAADGAVSRQAVTDHFAIVSSMQSPGFGGVSPRSLFR